MGLLERLARLDPRRKLRLELEQLRSAAAALAAERDRYLQERDAYLHERDAYLQQRDQALGERNEILRQRDVALGERNELRRQHDIAVGERDELRRQLDVAMGERSELRRQLDVGIGEHNEMRRQLDVLIGEGHNHLRQRDEAIGTSTELRRQLDKAIGENNQLAERIEQWVHRTDMAARRGTYGTVAMTRERPLLFLHLAKTGGVTINNMIVRNLSIGEYLVIRMPPHDDSVLWTWSNAEVALALAALAPEAQDRIRAILGHYSPSVQHHLPKRCAVMTMLREPVERLLSYFYYDLQRGVRPPAKFEDFVAEGTDLALDNYMTRILSGISELDPADKAASLNTHPRVDSAAFDKAAKTLDSCLIVGTTDLFDETLVLLAADLGWSLTDLVYQRANVTTDRRPAEDLTPGVRERLLKMNRYDVGLLERAHAHLARRIAAYRGDFDRDLSLFHELNSLFQRGTPAGELRRFERDALGNATRQPARQRS